MTGTRLVAEPAEAATKLHSGREISRKNM